MKKKRILLFFVLVIIIFILSCKKEEYVPQVPYIRNGTMCVNVIYKMGDYNNFDILLSPNATSTVVVIFGETEDNIQDTVTEISSKYITHVSTAAIFVKFGSSDYYTNTRGSIIRISNIR